MSFRSRARALQRATGLGYQQALAKIQSHDEQARALARERGWPLTRSDLQLAGAMADGGPIEVVEVPRVLDPLTEICTRLQDATQARAVHLIDARHRTVAHAGHHRHTLLLAASPSIRAAPPEPGVRDLGDGVRAYRHPLARGHTLYVVFDEQSSLGLVRLRARSAAEELDRLLARPAAGALPPPATPSGASGAPAEAVVFAPAPPKDRGKG